MILKFIDWEEEFWVFEEFYVQDKVYFVFIYGRRRVGKIEFVKQFINGKKVFYFLVKKELMEFELDRFVRVFNRKFNVFIEVENFEEFFERVKEFGKIVFVIDEFFYWVEEDKGIFLIFQYIWDEVLKGLKVFFDYVF